MNQTILTIHYTSLYLSSVGVKNVCHFLTERPERETTTKLLRLPASAAQLKKENKWQTKVTKVFLYVIRASKKTLALQNTKAVS